jgi:diacylglycerol O-acyltransferase / wax synthase
LTVEPPLSHPIARRLSRVDSAWLRMDNEVNLMLIVGVWLLSPGIALPVLRDRLRERLLRYPRFRQRVVHDTGGACWVHDAAFDLDHHVVEQPLPSRPGLTNRAALQSMCGDLAMQPLSPSRPLWQFHLVPGYEDGCAVVVRIHHSIGDGMALTSVMQAIADGGVDPPAVDDGSAPDDHAAETDWLAQTVLRPLTDLTMRAIGGSGDGLAGAIARLSPSEPPMTAPPDAARHGVQFLADAAALALMPDDAATRLKGRPVGRKRVAWSEPLPLDAVRSVGKALGCSINDVLLASVSGAIGGWLRAQGDDPDGQDIRAMVPVNLRPVDEAWKLGNRFGFAPLVLPMGIANPVERLYTVHQRMRALKGSHQPLLSYAVLALSGALAKPVQDAVLGLFARKTTAVMTHVPGPQVPLRFCGATLRQTLFWVPAAGSVGVGVSILSYAGGVQFGLMTDEAMCSEPQAIVERFTPEFDRLLWLTLMLPWREAS